MQPVQHQMMGYDRAITMFSPDGRLLQVEYAKKTVKQGSPAIGITCKDGVVLIADKRVLEPLIVNDQIEKIWPIEEHIVATAAGILSDARVLIERAQVKAQQHKVTYGSPVDILTIVKDIADLEQMCTQSGGLRPFGVSMLIAGVDANGIRLFETNPTGIFFPYYATAIGEFDTEIKEYLGKNYKQSMSMDDAIKLGIQALKKVLSENFSADRLEIAIIDVKDKKVKKLQGDKISKYLAK
ncbi:MAG: archaeal proteasome endopeptidase complex subunit alpha [archaeon]